MSFTAKLDRLALCVGRAETILWAHNGKSARCAEVWWLTSFLQGVAFACISGFKAVGLRDAQSVGLYLEAAVG